MDKKLNYSNLAEERKKALDNVLNDINCNMKLYIGDDNYVTVENMFSGNFFLNDEFGEVVEKFQQINNDFLFNPVVLVEFAKNKELYESVKKEVKLQNKNLNDKLKLIKKGLTINMPSCNDLLGASIRINESMQEELKNTKAEQAKRDAKQAKINAELMKEIQDLKRSKSKNDEELDFD